MWLEGIPLIWKETSTPPHQNDGLFKKNDMAPYLKAIWWIKKMVHQYCTWNMDRVWYQKSCRLDAKIARNQWFSLFWNSFSFDVFRFWTLLITFFGKKWKCWWKPLFSCISHSLFPFSLFWKKVILLWYINIEPIISQRFHVFSTVF